MSPLSMSPSLVPTTIAHEGRALFFVLPSLVGRIMPLPPFISKSLHVPGDKDTLTL